MTNSAGIGNSGAVISYKGEKLVAPQSASGGSVVGQIWKLPALVMQLQGRLKKS